MNNNPFVNQMPMPNFYGQTSFLPKYELNIVNGEAGAQSFRMAPNSKTVLIDETAPIVWFARTDSAGYLTVEPYDIIKHQTAAPISIEDLAARITKLEEQYVQQSTTKQPRKKQQQPIITESNVDSANQRVNE